MTKSARRSALSTAGKLLNYRALLILLSGVLFFFLIHCFFKSRQVILSHYDQMTAFQLRQDQNLPPGLIYFIGDSHTQGLATQAISSDSVNYGIGSDTTTGVLNRIGKYHSLKTARAIVLAIGFNDLKSIDNTEILRNLTLIIQQLPPDKPLFINTLLPLSHQYFNSNFTQRTMQLNQAIRNKCVSQTELYCIDAFKALADSDHGLKDTLHIGDGLHLNREGYNIWINTIRAALKQGN